MEICYIYIPAASSLIHILLLPSPIGYIQTLNSVLFRAKMACTKMEELRQLQYTMSWLSTLGGAFSALGEGQERCVSINYNLIYTRAFWKVGNCCVLCGKRGDRHLVCCCAFLSSVSIESPFEVRNYLTQKVFLSCQFAITSSGIVSS